jgi:hypothetical protein
VLPGLTAPARLVRAVSTVVLQVGECAVKVHPPGTDPLHLARVHAVLADCPVALTITAAPVVTSNGVVTVTPWTPPAPPVGWGQVGEVLRLLHGVPTAGALPSGRRCAACPRSCSTCRARRPRTAGPPRGAARPAGRARARPAVRCPARGRRAGQRPDDSVRTALDRPRLRVLRAAGVRRRGGGAALRRGELSDADYRSFVAAYEVDLRGWPGLALLDELCALSAVGFRLWTDRCAGAPAAGCRRARPAQRGAGRALTQSRTRRCSRRCPARPAPAPAPSGRRSRAPRARPAP